MSILTCQIGQCGNQLGESIFDKLVEEAESATDYHQLSTLDTFFTPSPKSPSGIFANSVLIDMEPKVIDCLMERGSKRQWDYDPSKVVVKQEGSGNNWAYGFNVHGSRSAPEILTKIRKSVERIDYLDGMLFLQSLAGGTGSGVGSRILTQIREIYPEKNIYSVAVLPRLSGEVILQFYNSIFSLSTLQNVSISSYRESSMYPLNKGMLCSY